MRELEECIDIISFRQNLNLIAKFDLRSDITNKCLPDIFSKYVLMLKVSFY